jgi:hypothetical protein
MTILIIGALVYVQIAHGLTVSWMWIFAAVMLFMSLSISLGNWMDRRTILTLEAGGVLFTNGLRAVNIPWGDLQMITVRPTRWGKTAHVLGRNVHFNFSMFNKMEFQGRTQPAAGFVDGQNILDAMIRSAALTRSSVEDQVYSYSRG